MVEFIYVETIANMTSTTLETNVKENEMVKRSLANAPACDRKLGSGNNLWIWEVESLSCPTLVLGDFLPAPGWWTGGGLLVAMAGPLCGEWCIDRGGA